MLIALRFPLADARPFVTNDGGRPLPPSAAAREFEARWAVRLCEPGLGRDSHCAARRFSSDGAALARFEIAIAYRAPPAPVSAIARVRAVHAQLASVRSSGQPPRPLAALGPQLASQYCAATTLPRGQGSGEPWWVCAAPPVTLVTYRAEDQLVLPAELHTTRWFDDGEVTLGHWWQPGPGRLHRVWFFGHERNREERARQLCSDLAELHCEQESLRLVLQLIARGALSPEPRSERSDRLQRYLHHAISRVQALRNALRTALCETSWQLIEPDDPLDGAASLATGLDTQLRRLDVRPNIRRKIVRHAGEEANPSFLGGLALIIADPETATAMQRLLRSPACRYLAAGTRVLLGDGATCDAVLAELDRLALVATPGDTVVIYYAGRGGWSSDPRARGWRLAPGGLRDGSPTISAPILADRLRAIRAARLLLVMDCDGGDAAGTTRSEDDLDRLITGTGRAVIAAWSAPSDPRTSRALTRHLQAALSGKAAHIDGTVGVLDVLSYLLRRDPPLDAERLIFRASDVDSNFVIAAGAAPRADALRAAPATPDLSRLCRAVATAFDGTELDRLYATIADLLHRDGRTDPLSSDLVGGTSHEHRVVSLVSYLVQRELLDYLVRGCLRERRDLFTMSGMVQPAPEPPAGRDLILFLAANPCGTRRLALDEECASIERELALAADRDRFALRSKWAVTVDELMRHLVALQPTILHVSGHGSQREPTARGPAFRDLDATSHAGIYLQDDQRQPHHVTAEALAQMIASAAPSIRVVVLNACFSDALAGPLCEVVDCVVGMQGAIDDDAARSFAVAFYRAIGNHCSVARAVDQAAATLAAKQLSGRPLPVCRTRSGIDPHRVVLSQPVHRRSS